ncbi:ShlB/FhaC/HecB family hemolysin secretion/activation protein [Ideonella sp. 4Y11]|uniref:ShlB/FhaC/HecB family hemolysin secretion/activation protein n=1 Tax=Ideonella aquatica TaxID=2824119 RepID=A0A940YX83_9BURK|nr:ShlB/FhaC/HecB family hemolysin secretion/activation protein [Ideonella aquatica]MBQ0960880.1 ShlB/FhaC/HecB family hemolysin secretion/activation protein [Ideonella aquatica]
MIHHTSPMRLRPWLQAGLLLGGLAVAPTAGAQRAGDVPPSRLTPDTLRPQASPRPLTLELTGTAPSAAPDGAERLFVTLEKAELSGSHPELDAAQRALLDSLAGRRISVAQVFEAATALEAGFARAGYPLVRVAVPPQSLEDGGALRLQAVDGFIESIDVQGLPERVREAVLRRTAALVGRRSLTQAELETRLARADDVPGLHLRSTLAAGQEAGAARLILDGSHQALALSLTADNQLDATLGRWAWGLSVSGNGLLASEDQLYASVRQSAGDPSGQPQGRGLSLLGAGLSLPLTPEGVTAGIEFTTSSTRPATTPGLPATLGRFRRGVGRIHWPLQVDRAQRLSANLSVEHIDQRNTASAFGVDLKHDRYWAVKLGLDHTGNVPPWGWIAAGASLVQGLGGRDADQARAEGVPLSRQGAQPRFTRALATLRWVVPIAATGSRLDLNAAAQTAFGRPLLQSEQLSLDGPTAASGFLPGSLAVDAGTTLRAEWIQPYRLEQLGRSESLAPYLFVADARGRVFAPTALEAARLAVRSYGLGLRIESIGPFGLPMELDLEWARGAGGAGDTQSSHRAWVALRTRF